MKVLIIEDELPAQKELERLLKRSAEMMGEHVEILDFLETIEESVEWISKNNEADLIFMDIQLADGKSFEIFSEVDVKVPVIFTTAYDEYAIRAFKVNSVDYLLKPIYIEYLIAALDKFKKIHSENTEKTLSGDKINQLLEISKASQQEYKKRFVATIGDKIVQVSVDDIAYFYADDNVVFLVTDQNKKYIINYKLEQLEQLLEPSLFFRITRKYLAKISAIREINKYFNSRLLLNLQPPTADEVVVSRAKVSEFISWMDE